MDILQAKEIVIAAGKKLVETGLIARTWGNVSCRIDEQTFVITPSGKAYESLTPDDIVLVRMDDLSYDGDVKPSSEKGIHAQCYLLRKDCNFVIHTHQSNASIISALGSDITRLGSKFSDSTATAAPTRDRDGAIGAPVVTTVLHLEPIAGAVTTVAGRRKRAYIKRRCHFKPLLPVLKPL